MNSTRRIAQFSESTPTLENYWRSVILFGRNVASYKFALGKSLLELADQGNDFVTLEELAVPFAQHLCEHLEQSDTQGTSASSKFLDTCRAFNRGELDRDHLVEATARMGFGNVIDAFHVVGSEDIPVRFFVDERNTRSGIALTDNLAELHTRFQYRNLLSEVEARWRLVETSWDLEIPRRALQVTHDPSDGLLVVQSGHDRRISLTSTKHALNGYQKGHCFYCNRPISVNESDPGHPTHVDHFFPWSLTPHGLADRSMNGVWNLVLACQDCNLSKSARVPSLRFLEKLHNRNDYLITSHHPLRGTLIAQTGSTTDDRRNFLQVSDRDAIGLLIHRWEPTQLEDLTL